LDNFDYLIIFRQQFSFRMLTFQSDNWYTDKKNRAIGFRLSNAECINYCLNYTFKLSSPFMSTNFLRRLILVKVSGVSRCSNRQQTALTLVNYYIKYSAKLFKLFQNPRYFMAIQQWVLTLMSCALLRFPNSPKGPFAFTLLTCSSKNIQVV